MKILFFLTLLANIVFFLWQLNIGGLDPVSNEKLAENSEKQIFLLSEVVPKKQPLEIASVDVVDVEQALAPLFNNEVEQQEDESIEEKEQSQEDEIIDELAIDSIPAIEDSTKQTTENKISNVANVQKNNGVSVLANDSQDNSKINQEIKSYCYQVGLFDTIQAIYSWLDLHEVEKDTFQLLKKERQVISSYLVYYPAATTYKESKANAEMLKRKGINDFWLFRKGELKGVISMGLFTKKSRAVLLQQKLSRIGLEVEIKERYKTELAHYVELSMTEKDFKNRATVSSDKNILECENSNRDSAEL